MNKFNIHRILPKDKLPPVGWYQKIPNALTGQMVEDLIDLSIGKKMKIMNNLIGGSETELRRYFLPEDKWEDIYERFEFFFENFNVWKLDIDAITEKFELLKYERGNECSPHVDFDYDCADRSKLTIIACVEDTSDAKLKILDDVVPLRPGQGVIFPSFAMHSVTKLTEGTRTVLAAWVTGPDLK